MFEKRKLPLIIFCLLILVFSGLTCISPWWEASTTKENEILNGIQLKVEYSLGGVVSAYNLSVDYQITALEIKGKIEITNVTINLKNEKSLIRIPAKLGLGKFYSIFKGDADVKRNEQGCTIDFVGNVRVDNVTFSLNFTYNTEEALELEEKKYSILCELELTTRPVTISVMELDANEEAKYELKSFLNTIWILGVIEFGLNVTIFALILTYMLTSKISFYKFSRYILIIATIIPLITFFLFANNIQGLISKLNNAAPHEVYTLNGSEIKSLFGEAKNVIYGPSLGWKLTFVVFALNAALFKLTGKIRKVEETGKALNIA